MNTVTLLEIIPALVKLAVQIRALIESEVEVLYKLSLNIIQQLDYLFDLFIYNELPSIK